MTLPNFLIAGERRCGTTSLANLLEQHPSIALHRKRDSGFFVDERVRKGFESAPWEETHSLEEYRKFFSSLDDQGRPAVGEKSADYLFYRPAHRRIRAYLPDAKLVLILRNPVQRAWSHYWNEVGKAREQLSFEQALAKEDARVKGGGFDGYHLSYATRGKYDENLTEFFKVIPRQQCHVVILEDLIANRDLVLAEITSFLGIPDFQSPPEEKRSNSNWTMVPKPWASRQPVRSVASGYAMLVSAAAGLGAKTREEKRALAQKMKRPFFMEANTIKMQKETRRQLEEKFSSHIANLETMLGKSLHSWKPRT